MLIVTDAVDITVIRDLTHMTITVAAARAADVGSRSDALVTFDLDPLRHMITQPLRQLGRAASAVCCSALAEYTDRTRQRSQKRCEPMTIRDSAHTLHPLKGKQLPDASSIAEVSPKSNFVLALQKTFWVE